MTENEARYIIRMIQAFRNNILFTDATDRDADELDIMKARYQEAGRWDRGAETAIIEFILRVDKNGIPGGEYLGPEQDVRLWQAQRGTPLIERPSNGVVK